MRPGATWPGQAWDCRCPSAEAHDRDGDRGADSCCRTHHRRRGLALLEELRRASAEQLDNDVLVLEKSPATLESVPRWIESVNEALSALDTDSLEGEALMAASVQLEDLQRRLDSAKATVLGSMDRSGVTEASTGLAAKRWKAHRTRANEATVGRELRIARMLERFGEMAEALRSGVVSGDHLLALAAVCNERIADALVEHEHRIVRVARMYPFRRFVRFLRRLAATLDEDGPQPDCGDRDTAAMARDFEGHLHLRLELSGHNAVEAERIINAELHRQRRLADAEQREAGIPVPDASVLRARAVMELLRRGAKANPKSPKPAVEAILPVTVDDRGRPTAVGTTDGADLDDHTAALLLCDAVLQPVITDPTGMPLRLGRSVRRFTRGQRAALTIRDGGCIFPGCDQPVARCDAHHETPWEAGGATDESNGCMLCRRHHGLVHANDPWVLVHYDLKDLPPQLAAAHRARASAAGLDAASDVRVWRSPRGELHLAQNSLDHSGPAPPRRAAA